MIINEKVNEIKRSKIQWYREVCGWKKKLDKSTSEISKDTRIRFSSGPMEVVQTVNQLRGMPSKSQGKYIAEKTKKKRGFGKRSELVQYLPV